MGEEGHFDRDGEEEYRSEAPKPSRGADEKFSPEWWRESMPYDGHSDA